MVVASWHLDIVFLWENLFKYDAVMKFMTRVMTGSESCFTQVSSPPSPVRHTPKGEGATLGNILSFRNDESKHDLAEILKNLDSECRNCAPITPLECITRCQVWKLKNELRSLREIMDNPNFTKELLNVLKNQTRVNILKSMVRTRYSVSRLQQELKKNGHSYSQEAINQEYIQPLVAVGLAAQAREEYYATNFGSQLTQIIGDTLEFANLPVHSECYEEALLSTLMTGPKTFEEIKKLIPPSIASRILKRLRTTGLIESPTERDYVFFFKTKRDPNNEELTKMEREVYLDIADEGISAKNIAKKIGLSLRRVYKHLRKLKGKKLIFVRITPKPYSLTAKGKEFAGILQELTRLVDQTWRSTELVVNEKMNS